MASTNSIESVWANLKRRYNVVYHHFRKKHIDRYINEFTFRLNEYSVKIPKMDRLRNLLKVSKRKRLTYKRLTK